jgi:hypothetical protein
MTKSALWEEDLISKTSHSHIKLSQKGIKRQILEGNVGSNLFFLFGIVALSFQSKSCSLFFILVTAALNIGKSLSRNFAGD